MVIIVEECIFDPLSLRKNVLERRQILKYNVEICLSKLLTVYTVAFLHKTGSDPFADEWILDRACCNTLVKRSKSVTKLAKYKKCRVLHSQKNTVMTLLTFTCCLQKLCQKYTGKVIHNPQKYFQIIGTYYYKLIHWI